MPAKLAVLIALAVFTLAYAVVFVNAVRRAPVSPVPTALQAATGFVTNFFDTLGIGSFATSTAFFQFRSMVPAHLMPGTLNVGHTLPTILQAFIYIAAIEVEIWTLVLLIASAVTGAWLGAGLVVDLPRRTVRLCMGGTLLVAAVAMLMRQLDLFPAGGTALELRGGLLAAGMAGNFAFAAISTLGIGFYAPCMTLVSLLGMNPAAAFPIMMGSSAFLMPVASARFAWRQAYLAPVAVGLALGGLAGVPLAAFVVQSLPLTALRWLVIAVVLCAAWQMIARRRD